MSRESIVGFVVALRIYLAHDEKAVFNEWMKTTEYMRNELKDLPGIETAIIYQCAVED